MWKKVASVARILHRVTEWPQSLTADTEKKKKKIEIMEVSDDCLASSYPKKLTRVANHSNEPKCRGSRSFCNFFSSNEELQKQNKKTKIKNYIPPQIIKEVSVYCSTVWVHYNNVRCQFSLKNKPTIFHPSSMFLFLDQLDIALHD